MTSASITPASPRTPAKRTPPDPARVYQTYLSECAINPWGAYKRTADRYQRSDEWARKVVKKHLAARETKIVTPPAEPDELLYQPPPGAYPEPRPAPVQERAAPIDTANHAPLCEGTTAEIPTETPTVDEETPTEAATVTSTPNVEGDDRQPAAPDNSQPIELKEVPRPANLQPSIVDPYRTAPRAAMPGAYRRLQAQQETRRLAALQGIAWGWWLGVAVAVVLIAPAFWGLWWLGVLVALGGFVGWAVVPAARLWEE